MTVNEGLSPKTSSPRRLDIDLMRLLACLFVVVYHADSIGTGTMAAMWVRSLMSSCVPIFFFTSGLLLSGRNRPPCRWFARALRLAVLTVVWAVLYGCYISFSSGSISLRDIVTASFTFKVGWTNWLWFLPALAVIYMLAPFLLCVQREGGRLWKALIAVVVVSTFGFDLLQEMATLANVASGTGYFTKLTDYLWNYLPLRWTYRWAIGYFVLGMQLAGKKPSRCMRGLSIVGVLLAPAGLMAYGIAYASLSGSYYDFTWSGYGTVFTLATVLSLHVLCGSVAKGIDRAGVVGRLVSLVGANSFAVYVLHHGLLVTPSFFNPYGKPWMIGVPLCLLIVFVTAAIGHLARKTPLAPLLAG